MGFLFLSLELTLASIHPLYSALLKGSRACGVAVDRVGIHDDQPFAAAERLTLWVRFPYGKFERGFVFFNKICLTYGVF